MQLCGLAPYKRLRLSWDCKGTNFLLTAKTFLKKLKLIYRVNKKRIQNMFFTLSKMALSSRERSGVKLLLPRICSNASFSLRDSL